MPIITLIFALVAGAFFLGRTITNPTSQWLKESQDSTTITSQETQVPTPSPTLTPTPTSKPVVKGVTTKSSPTIVSPSPKPTEPNPINVNIIVEEFKRQSEGMVKCETKDGWVPMKKEACTAYQEQWRKEKTAEIVEEVKSKLHQDTLQQLENELKQKGYTPEEIEKHKQEFDKYIKEQGSIPMPTPCICIESWGAGGFRGYCRDKAHCIIKYSCLLPDKKRLGVWNDDQTVCLEEHVRYAGQYEGQ